MGNKHVKIASLLTKISGFIFLFVGIILLVISMFKPIEITLNNTYTRATIWQIGTYPGPLGAWLTIIIVMIILGIIGCHLVKESNGKQPLLRVSP